MFTHTVKGYPSIKDTVEALGVPHTEVDCILASGRSVDFSCQMKGGETFRIYLDSCRIPVSFAGRIKKLRPRIPACPQFILDAHLGKLARHLRLLGFDTVYDQRLEDEEIIVRAVQEKRVVLTRDLGILKNNAVRLGAFVQAIDSARQIKEVIKKFGLEENVRPFSLCLECSGRIRRVAKSKIANRLPPKVRRYYKTFYLCRKCGKVYWKGSHYAKLAKFVKRIKEMSSGPRRPAR